MSLTISTFEELESQYPDIAARVKEEIDRKVQDAEKQIGPKNGDRKLVLADEKAKEVFTGAASGVYDVIDLFAGFPGPVDKLVQDIIIPNLPDLINKSVSWFNDQEIFEKLGF